MSTYIYIYILDIHLYSIQPWNPRELVIILHKFRCIKIYSCTVDFNKNIDLVVVGFQLMP